MEHDAQVQPAHVQPAQVQPAHVQPAQRLYDIYELRYQLSSICKLTTVFGPVFRGTLDDPKFVEFRFKKYLPSTARFVRSDVDIHTAVDLWCERPLLAEREYGHIADWDTSNVTGMSRLFMDKELFNGDLGSWRVSNVSDMFMMFTNAETFNRDIGGWDVSRVTDMCFMFMGARSFNRDIGAWDMSSVQHRTDMFCGAEACKLRDIWWMWDYL